MISIEELIFEYKEGKNGLEALLLNLDPNHPQAEQDKFYINSMLREMKSTIEWLQTGRDPKSRRGMDKRFIYDSNEVVMSLEDCKHEDALYMMDLDVDEDKRELTIAEKRAIKQVISILSIREKQCFILHTVCDWSYGKIAEELNVKRATVQQFITRAKTKIVSKVHELEEMNLI